MSKTSTSLLLETNQKRGIAQENAFLYNFFRLPADFNASFARSASSDAPLQLFAIASAQGEDTLSAMALQGVMRILEKRSADLSNQTSIDFNSFTDALIGEMNQAVCAFCAKNNGSAVRISITLLVLEGDALRVLHVGNTRAVLIRDGKVIPITEDQTVAHRYVQSGAISAENERSHPERNTLTQYIGRFPQDGPVRPEKKVAFKLRTGDEIALLGTGIHEAVSIQERDAILRSSNQPEYKTKEILRAAQTMIRGGLSAMVIRVDETTVLPAGLAVATASQMTPSTASSAYPAQIVPQDSNLSEGSIDVANVTSKPQSKAKAVIVPIVLFLSCLLAGYLGAMFIFRIGNLIPSTPTPTESGVEATLGKIKYLTADMVAFYPEASIESVPSRYLSRGEVVIFYEESGSFSKVKTTDGVEGFVLSVMLSDQDPTIGESLPEMSADPTPIPTQESTTAATSRETSASESTAATSSETLATESTPTSETSQTSETSESTTASSGETSATTESTTTESTTTATTSATTSETSQTSAV